MGHKHGGKFKKRGAPKPNEWAGDAKHARTDGGGGEDGDSRRGDRTPDDFCSPAFEEYYKVRCSAWAPCSSATRWVHCPHCVRERCPAGLRDPGGTGGSGGDAYFPPVLPPLSLSFP